MMSNSRTHARNAASASTKNYQPHMFPWNWKLNDLQYVPKNGKTVFSCFACGGGSSMGYKLAGYTVIGNCEIDPAVMKVYRANHHPKYSFLMDVRDFLALPDEKIPEELFNLDILDGSPPCSVFSMAGAREDGWNKEKVFREGQAAQRLDDLFFWFIKIAKRLQPKVVIAENVKGLVQGSARGYVNEIIKAYHEAGYQVQIFLLNSGSMGVPQRRERTFFIAYRNDLKLPKLKLSYNEAPILFGDVRTETGEPLNKDSQTYKLLQYRREGDTNLSDINRRTRGKDVGFTNPIIADNSVAPTLAAGGTAYRFYDGMLVSDDDCRNIQTFQQDYDFGAQQAKYICGMSVPPVMMAHIAHDVWEQWFYELDTRADNGNGTDQEAQEQADTAAGEDADRSGESR